MDAIIEREDDNPFAPAVSLQADGALGAVEAARAQSEVQGAIISAKRFPRDPFAATNRILQACKREKLAREALYAYPRGEQIVTGPSIRLAEVLAQAWGNLDFGIRELEQRDDESVVQSYCWDLETNVRRTVDFTVPHVRHTKKGSYKLSDPRDVYELIANNGARRLRSCILAVIPGDVVELAVVACRKTQKEGGGRPLEDRVRDMVTAFAELGVPQPAIEKRVGHALTAIDADELVDLTAVYRAIKDGAANRGEFFELAGGASEKAKDLSLKIKEQADETTARSVRRGIPKPTEPLGCDLCGKVNGHAAGCERGESND